MHFQAMMGDRNKQKEHNEAGNETRHAIMVFLQRFDTLTVIRGQAQDEPASNGNSLSSCQLSLPLFPVQKSPRLLPLADTLKPLTTSSHKSSRSRLPRLRTSKRAPCMSFPSHPPARTLHKQKCSILLFGRLLRGNTMLLDLRGITLVSQLVQKRQGLFVVLDGFIKLNLLSTPLNVLRLTATFSSAMRSKPLRMHLHTYCVAMQPCWSQDDPNPLS